jgi:quinoprotein glucose dehydrogenase
MATLARRAAALVSAVATVSKRLPSKTVDRLAHRAAALASAITTLPRRLPTETAGWLALALGARLAFSGLPLIAGGTWLALLGGSWYYVLAGAALVISGALLAARRLHGAVLYAGLVAATTLWAISEVGLDGWALIPRLVGPYLVLLPVIASLPLLAPGERGRRLARWSLASFAVAASVIVAAVAVASRPAPAGVMPAPGAAAATPFSAAKDWPAYGGGTDADRYSALRQIDRDNVATLRRAWVALTGDLVRRNYAPETTPLKVGDTLYLCTGRNILIALDAASGAERWRRDPHVPDTAIPYTAACRGVVYYAPPSAAPDQQCAERIIEGTVDARLVAVDARTGEPCKGFGAGGQVDTTVGLGLFAPSTVSFTSPPALVRGVIVVGHRIADGMERNMPSGVILGYDAVTGALRWAWDMGQPGETGLPAEGETFTRGTPNMWTIAIADEAQGFVYLPFSGPAGDFWSAARTPIEQEYSTTLVALDVLTGRPVWKFQTVHSGVWDYDLGGPPSLITYDAGNGPTPALVLPTKTGDIYVLDRRTGKPLTGVEERPAPQGGAEPEQRSPTQPASLYHSLRPHDLTERSMWGMSPYDQLLCRILFRRASYKGVFTPPTDKQRYIQYPGANGGVDWGGLAVDPARAVLVANYSDIADYARLRTKSAAELAASPRPREPQLRASPYRFDDNVGWRMPITGLMCKAPPYGHIRAVDLATGRMIWDRPLGTARANGPFGAPSMLPIDIGTPNNGGSVVTAGGLVFIAAATDNLIRDIETGRTLWQDVLPAGGQATPMTYEADGRQYVVVVAGGHHLMDTPAGDYVVAYALPAPH